MTQLKQALREDIAGQQITLEAARIREGQKHFQMLVEKFGPRKDANTDVLFAGFDETFGDT